MKSLCAAIAMIALGVCGLPPAVAEPSLTEQLGGLPLESDTFDDRFFGSRFAQWPIPGRSIAEEALTGVAISRMQWPAGVPLPRNDPRFSGPEPWKFNVSLAVARDAAIIAELCINLLMPENQQDVRRCGI